MNYFGTEEEIKESEEDLEDDPTTSLREIDDDSFIQPQATPVSFFFFFFFLIDNSFIFSVSTYFFIPTCFFTNC